jgi:Fe2+ transport system protein FeoA
MEDVMGRPMGSTNREKPFNDALRIELRSNPLAMRRIAAKLIERAEEGDLSAISEIADGKPYADD